MSLSTEQQRQIYIEMLRTRLLEERLIQMFKQNQGFFWIGGPGEEAFNVPLGMQIKKGEGCNYDYLHLHYRSCGILLAMGMDPIDPMRQMRNTITDPFSQGRNFSSHYSKKAWNLTPINSPIEVQHVIGIGTAIAQRDHGGDGITIINGGDAGTAEGDFASSLIWASRPGQELPMLMIVTNNGWGISTDAGTQHGEQHIADRAKPFGIKSAVVNGNDVAASWQAISEAMDYVRTERKPFLLEAKVSRLNSHSSASGAVREQGVEDPLATFEQQLLDNGVIAAEEVAAWREQYETEFRQLAEQAANEPQPTGKEIYDHTYYQQMGKHW